jgi:hypothetical protein
MADGIEQELRLWHMAGHVLAHSPQRHVTLLNRWRDQSAQRRRWPGAMISDDIVTPGG